MVAYSQLESAWPVPGSVAVESDLVYAAAGRTWAVDGGIAFCAFRLEDGSTAWARKKGDRNDLPVSDGNAFYVRGYRFSDDYPQTRGDGPPRTPLSRTPPWAEDSRRGGGPKLEGGFYGLTDATISLFPPWIGHNRMFIKNMLGCRYAGIGALLMTWDSTDVFCYGLRGPSVSRDSSGPWRVFQKKIPIDKKQGSPPDGWSTTLLEDDRVDGMMLTADALVTIGATGAKGTTPKGVLRTYSRDEGKLLREVELPGIPAFQSLSAIPGRVFVTTTDGCLLCIGEE